MMRRLCALVVFVLALTGTLPVSATDPSEVTPFDRAIGESAAVVSSDGVSATTRSYCGQVWVYVVPTSVNSPTFQAHLPMTVYVSEPSRFITRRQVTIFNPGSPTLNAGVSSPVLFNAPASGTGPGAIVELVWNGGSEILQTEPYINNCYGSFVPSIPTRVLDTRVGTGRSGAGPALSGAVVELDVRNALDRRAEGVTAVAMNVTATNPQTAGYVTVYPCGSNPPNASNLNFVAGETAPNLVVVDIVSGVTNPAVCLFSSTTTDLIADVTGYFIDNDPPRTQNAGMFNALASPQRLIDTRDEAIVTAGSTLRVRTAGRNGIPASGVAAMSMNITATEPQTAGYLTAFPCDTEVPNASNVNFEAGQTRPNGVIVGTGTNGDVCVYASTTTHVIVDAVGYYSADQGTAYWPFKPYRFIDSRLSNFTLPAGQVAPILMYIVQAGDVVNFNVTVLNSTSDGYLSLFPCADGRPATSSMNFAAGQTIANNVMVRIDVDRKMCMYANARVQFILDMTGVYYATRG